MPDDGKQAIIDELDRRGEFKDEGKRQIIQELARRGEVRLPKSLAVTPTSAAVHAVTAGLTAGSTTAKGDGTAPLSARRPVSPSPSPKSPSAPVDTKPKQKVPSLADQAKEIIEGNVTANTEQERQHQRSLLAPYHAVADPLTQLLSLGARGAMENIGKLHIPGVTKPLSERPQGVKISPLQEEINRQLAHASLARRMAAEDPRGFGHAVSPDTTRSVEAMPSTGAAGVGKGVANTLMGFATVDNAVIGAAMGAPGLTKGAGEILGRAAAGYFGYEAAKQAHEKIGEWDKSGRKDTAALTEGVLSAAIAATAGHHAAGSPISTKVIPALAKKATEHIERGKALQSKAQEAYQAAEEHLSKQAQEIVTAAGTEGANTAAEPIKPTTEQQAEIDRRAAARRPVQQAPAKPEPIPAAKPVTVAPEKPAGETKAKEPVKTPPATKKATAKPAEPPKPDLTPAPKDASIGTPKKEEVPMQSDKTRARVKEFEDKANRTTDPATERGMEQMGLVLEGVAARTPVRGGFHVGDKVTWISGKGIEHQGFVADDGAVKDHLQIVFDPDHPNSPANLHSIQIHPDGLKGETNATQTRVQPKGAPTERKGNDTSGAQAEPGSRGGVQPAKEVQAQTEAVEPQAFHEWVKAQPQGAIRTTAADLYKAWKADHPATTEAQFGQMIHDLPRDQWEILTSPSGRTKFTATDSTGTPRQITGVRAKSNTGTAAPAQPAPAALSPRAPVTLTQAEANTLGMHFDKGHALGDDLTAAEKPFRVDAGQANYLRKLAEEKGLDKTKLPALYPDTPRKGAPTPGTKDIEGFSEPSQERSAFKANRSRSSFAVGQKALLRRLDFEARNKRGALSRDSVEVGRQFIKDLDPRYLDKLGSSYFKEATPSGAPGSYIGKIAHTSPAYSRMSSLIEIGKALTNFHIEPERVIPHEIAHHIEQQVAPEHLDALNKEYLRQKKQFGEAVRYARGQIRLPATEKPLDTQGKPQSINSNQARFMSDSYRYDNFSEFFAESLADRVIENHFKDNATPSAKNIFGRMVASARDFIEQVYGSLLGLPDKRPSQRIYNALMKGEYGEPLTAKPKKGISKKDTQVRALGPQELHSLIPLDKALGAVVGKERAEAWTESVNKFGASLRGLVNPTGFGSGSEVETRAGRDYFGQEARIADQREQAFKPLRAAFDRLPAGQGVKFMFDIERDNVHADPKAQQVGDLLRDALDKKRDQITAQTGRLEAYFEHYFPHEWKSPSKATQFFGEGRRPLEGSKGFLKKRTIPTNEAGMFPKGAPAGLESMNEAQIREEITKQGGLQPLTLNPVELAQLKLQSMDRYLFAQKWFAEMKKQKRAVFLPAMKAMPDGWAKVNDAIANVKEFRETVKADGSPGAPEIVERGQWIVPEGAARIINNHLSPGFSGHETFGSVYRVMAATNNAMNMAQLGLSGFHATTMAMESLVSENARALSKATQGKPVEALQAAAWAHTGAAPFRDFYRGSKVLQEYRVPGSVGGNVPEIVKSLVAGGGRVTLAKEFRLDAMESFGKALRKRDVPGMALSALPATLEGSMAWLMRDTVPKMKLGAFAELLEDEMGKATKGGKVLTEDQHRELAARTWDNIENRFGQLNYDNLFWDKAFKEAGHLAVRSLGWNLGTIREIGGAAVDVGRTRSRLQKGEGVLTPRMTYAVSLAYTTALAGAVYSYLHGHRPETLEDYFHPKNHNGQRITLPGYGKDVQHYYEDPLGTIYGKKSPLVDVTIETLQNKDFFGKPVRSETRDNGKIIAPVENYFRYLAKQVIPFSVRPKKDDSVAETIKKVFTTEEGREQAAGITPYHPKTGGTGKGAGGMSTLPRVSTPRLPRMF